MHNSANDALSHRTSKRNMGLMVTVGTAVASRPPYRSRRALLTHRAPPSGSGVEAMTRQRVYGSDWRKETGDELDEPLPVEACRLAASLERFEPEPLHLVEEPPQARVVTRDCEVVQMPFQHLFHPSPGFRDGVVHYPAQLDLDRQQLGSHPLLDRLAPDDERAPFA
jgi:hypothetical protein